MAWTALGIAGILCLVAAAYLLGGLAVALLVAGVALLLVAVDGRRA